MIEASYLSPLCSSARRSVGDSGCSRSLSAVQTESLNSSVRGSWNRGPKLSHKGIEYFIDAYCRCGALIVSPLVEELFQKRRNKFFLNPVVVNLPGARASTESHAPRIRPQRRMHRQPITANQAAVVSDIGDLLETRSPFRQHIHEQSFMP